MNIGPTLAHYRISEKLGAGGMGEVYLAYDTRLSRNVALKVLLHDVTADPERRARFEREARAIAALNHPNIVTVHSIEQADGVHFITMELVAGKPLSTILPPAGLAVKQFFRLALQLTDAIGAAHEQGVTHRDLKPENVMVAENSRVKVLDFGLAKLKPASVDSTSETVVEPDPLKTTHGQVLGTAAYMSPEQIEGTELDHRSDIFSLGIILHEMITGHRPFRGNSNVSTMSSILRDEPPLVTKVNPALPGRLARLIQRCLEKEPARRYQSAVDLRNDLAELQQDFDSGVSISGPGAKPTNRRMMYATAGLAILAVAAGLYALLRNRREAGVPLESMGDVAFSQLTHAAGQEIFPSLSPDGRFIAYASAALGNFDIFSHRVGGENPVNLTSDSTVDDTQPAFAPDGERIAFRSEREGGGIFVLGATGESVRRATTTGYHPAWSPNGQQLLYVTQNVTDPAVRFTSSEMWVATLATGERRLVTKDDAAQPSWSPHGHRIAYWGRAGGQGAGDIWTIPAAGGEAVPVTTEPSIDWNPVWAPDGRYLYFSSDRGGTMNLWRVAIDEVSGRTAGRPQAVTTGGGASNRHPTISKDGTRLAYVSLIESMNVQRTAFDPTTGRVRGSPDWVTRGSRGVAQPEPSPDGRRLAFNSSGKQEDIFVSQADGAGLQQLTDDSFKDRSAKWSPDGQRIAFYSDRTGTYEIWTINRDGSNLQQLTRSPGAHYPVWSPDGLRMAFSTHSPNGAFIFDTDKPWDRQMPVPLPAIADKSQTFEIWSWSPDGRRLAGQKHLADLSHAGLGIHEIGSQQIQWLTDFGEWPVWLRDSHRLLLSAHGKLFLIDSRTGKYHEVLSLPQQSLGSVGLAPDNHTIYFTLMATEADVWMITMR
jgi:eukaryotic-like serine/threonine-protein kinase